MGILSNISGKKAVKIFEKFGYSVDHQSGSHIILFSKNRPTLSLPNHKELAPALLKGLIKKSGIAIEEFIKFK